jgi:hypothetical protein
VKATDRRFKHGQIGKDASRVLHGLLPVGGKGVFAGSAPLLGFKTS